MKHYLPYLIAALLVVCRLPLDAQIGGRHVYDFLNLTPSARLVALGGINVSTLDDDPNLATMNPALLNEAMHRHATLSFSNYLAGIRYGYAGYSHHFEGIGTFHSGIQYMNSGEMQGADEFGNLTNTFYANELVWMVGYARTWRHFRYGSNLKFISSTLAPGYSSAGLALDLGGSYRGPEELFSAGVVVRNAGLQLSTYVPGASREPLPFELTMGLSNKLRYMPMRFSITATNLDHPRLIYRDPNPEPVFDLAGNPVEPRNVWVDNIFRHAVFSTEFLLGDFMRLRAGYNHLRRQELRSQNRSGVTGFSFGGGIRARRFAFDYGFGAYGLSNTFFVHQFSLILNFEQRGEAPALPEPVPVVP
ncbi:MAG: hypothetical protein OHK0039_13990 [Bacteroidia bacterium]